MIEVTHGTFALPDEIRAALDSPARLRVQVHDDGYLLAPTGLRGRFKGPFAKRTDTGYHAPAIADGRYGVASHHPSYFLMPVVEDDAAKSREEYWASRDGYHEHLEPTTQDEGARTFSEQFVRDWLLPTGGRSFLELGCGAGRNLAELRRQDPDVELHGIDIHADAVATARRIVPQAAVDVGSLYELGRFSDGSVDVVFTAGVLMHVPHDKADAVIDDMLRIARVAVVHSELHGAPHDFGFHRYARDYGAIHQRLGRAAKQVVKPVSDGTGGETATLAVSVQVGS